MGREGTLSKEESVQGAISELEKVSKEVEGEISNS